VEKRIQQKIPDYRGAVNSIDEGMQMLSGWRAGFEDFGTARTPKSPSGYQELHAEQHRSYQQLKSWR